MADSSRLNHQKDLMSPMAFSAEIQHSPFLYHGYDTTKNFYVVRKDITPANPVADYAGSITEFRVDATHDKTGPIQLFFTLPAFALPGGSVFARYVDFIGFAAWEKIELNYSGQNVYTIYPEDLFEKHRRLPGVEARDAINELIAGDKSAAERDALARAGQTIIVDLNFPFTRGTSRFLEIQQLAQYITIKVFWKNMREIIQHDVLALPAGASITDVKLRITNIHVEKDERDHHTASTQLEHGLIKLYEDFQSQIERIPAATTGQYELNLRNFDTLVKRFGFILRLYSDLQTDWTNQPFENLQPIVRWKLVDASGDITEWIEDRYNRFYLHRIYHDAPAGEYIYAHSFVLDPDDLLNCTGGFGIGNSTNPKLVLDFGGVVTAGDIQCYMFANEYNLTHQVRGDLQPAFR